MSHYSSNPHIWNIPFKILPEAKEWQVGQTYLVAMKLKQTELTEEGASFEIINTSIKENSTGHTGQKKNKPKYDE